MLGLAVGTAIGAVAGRLTDIGIDDDLIRQIYEEEPVSLAEEIAEGTERYDDERTNERYEQIKQSGDLHIAQLQRMTMAELIGASMPHVSPMLTLAS